VALEPSVIGHARARAIASLPAATPGEAALRRQLMEVLLAPATPGRVTYEEFLALTDEDTLAEWVDGEIVMSSPASYLHQDIAGFLESVMRVYAETRHLGVVCSAPFQMKMSQGREPDLLFIANDRLDRLQSNYLDGPADLVVEIVSPESVGRDRGDKFTEYEAGGVPEYWLLDPQRRWAEFYHLEGERYRLAFAGAEGEYRARNLPGFHVRVEWLWQQPLPRVLDVIRELGLI
jgi:Uma2 family endonuclease